ncbi:MAG: PDZ domain-containing protein [Ruminococcaceae bacterium]|nr:PDZ domain-containing protein [Oscillospiraceae bacterium]
MNRKISLGAALAIMLLGVLITFQITVISVDKQYSEKLAEITSNQINYQKLSTIDQTVRRNFVKPIDEEALENQLITGYFKGLGDKYSYYMTPNEYAAYLSLSSDKKVGIGITASYDIENDAIAVYSVVSGSPAATSGITAGDLIIAVDGNSVSDVGYHSAVEMVSGEIGSVCTLTVLSGTGRKVRKDVKVTRAQIEIQSVFSRMIDEKIAYVSISEFSESTASQFISAMDNLIASGAQRFIYDIRSNPGGELDSVRAVLDYLLPEGPIIRMYSADGTETSLQSDARCVDYPSVTLINIATASAAELFAAALKDYGMTTLVGETTFGKGSIQTTITLPDRSGITLSTAMYSPPKSDSIEGVGVKPDIEIKQDIYNDLNLIDTLTDTQLKKAIELLSDNN